MANSQLWQSSRTLACTAHAPKLLNLGSQQAFHSKKYPPCLKTMTKTSAIISRSSPTQRMTANAASQGHPSLSQDPPNMRCTSDCVGGVHWCPWKPACHHQRIQQFFLSLSLRNRSHPLLSWEQCTQMGKIQQSTSNSGNGRRDSNGTAMAMDSVTATQQQTQW